MDRLTCPSCDKKAVEQRAANRPQNVKLRKVGDIHDQVVCRNCKWTGEEEDLGQSFTEPTESGPATEW